MKSNSVTPFEMGTVRGFLHEPAESARHKLVLTHGAGSNFRALLLVAVASAFCNAGYAVLRCDLPFRQRRPFGPPSPKLSAEDRAGLKAAVTAVRSPEAGKVFLGGHSYGGRQASILSADEPQCCDGLLLLSYPLHPPNKPYELRTAHLSKLQTPVLFVHGTADPFGSIDEMRSALELIPAHTELVAIEGAGHDLARGNFDIATLLVGPFEQLVCR
jgi:uncharacterized protein